MVEAVWTPGSLNLEHVSSLLADLYGKWAAQTHRCTCEIPVTARAAGILPETPAAGRPCGLV